MAKFNTTTSVHAHGRGPIVAEPTPSAHTHEGGAGYTRDTKSELFLLAVVNFVGENTFYETAKERDTRFSSLVRDVAISDIEWLTSFVRWLRVGANMRSAPIVAACEGVHARLKAGLAGGNRALVNASMNRADEPGELLAYWFAKFGRALPTPIKRGLADAAKRLYNEYGLLKYDTASHGFRFGDVLDLAHPTPAADKPWQGHLFRHALDRRHGRDKLIPAELSTLTANAFLRVVAATEPEALLNPNHVREAGMTWEDVLSLAGSKVDKAKLWAAMIPSMGFMALARNLRNFDEAGVSDEAAAKVIARFTDPAQVAKSRMFPFRWLSAYEQAPSLRWGHALDQALRHSLSALPAFSGRTLVLVDTSASMTSVPYSAKSKVTPIKAAAVFGVALAAKGENVDLVGFADGYRPFRHHVAKGASVIREVDRFVRRSGEDGHGTAIAESLRQSYNGHDRVVIVSDMQTMDSGVTTAIPAHVPIYGFNLGGYRAGAIDAGQPHRIELGGLTDATFKMIPLLESGRSGDWSTIFGQ